MNISQESMERKSISKYGWYIIALGALTHIAAVAIPRICMPVLFNEIAGDLGLDVTRLGLVWGMFSLGGVFVALIGGMLGDRFGVKRVIFLLCFLGGVAGALRGMATNFTGLASAMFFFGMIQSIIPINVHKTASIWFSGKGLARANGILSLGMAIGFALGSILSSVVLSPLLGGWRNVLYFYGGISVVIGILWIFTREAPQSITKSNNYIGRVSFRQALSSVIRIRNVWLLGLFLMGWSGCIEGMVGYLPYYLKTHKSWTDISADGALFAFNIASVICTVPIALLSDKLRSRKAVLLLAVIVTVIGVGLLSTVNGAAVWAMVIMTGIFRDGSVAVFVTFAAEMKGVGVAYAGTAIGLMFTLERIGLFLAPSIGNSLSRVNAGLPFIFWALLAAAAFVGLYLLKENKPDQG